VTKANTSERAQDRSDETGLITVKKLRLYQRHREKKNQDVETL